MAKMENLGRTFVSKLQQLDIKDAKNVDGLSIDWVFMSPENAPLTDFVQWFCENVSSADVLTEEEVTQYADLVAAEEVLEGQQLEDMTQCLSGVDALGLHQTEDFDEVLSKNNTNEDFALQMEKLDEQIQKVNFKKNQMSLQNMKISGQLTEMTAELCRQNNSVSQHQFTTLSAVSELSENFDKLNKVSEKIAALIKRIPMPETGYLLSTDLTALREEERNFSQSLKQYIKKQFPEGPLSSSSLTESLTLSEEDELSLVRSVSEARHTKHSQELQRLHRLIEECELEVVAEEEKEARCLAEVEEASLTLERIKRGYYGELSETSLQQEIRSSEVQHRVASEEVCRQQRTVNDLVKKLTERHSTTTLIADATTKISRQKYCSERQDIVYGGLLQQVSRQNFLCILLQCEAEKVRLSTQLIGEVKTMLEEQVKQTALRLDYLNELSDEMEEEKVMGKLPASLSTLSKLLDAHQQKSIAANSTISNIISSSADGAERIKTADNLASLWNKCEEGPQLLSSQLHPYSYRLNKLLGKCSLLEECLTGHATQRLPSSLPHSWLPSDLTDKQEEVETRALDFQRKMMSLLTQYETKKMMLSAQPEVLAKREHWR